VKLIILAAALLVLRQPLAQEQYGAAFSNYTPTTSVFLNPSSMLDAKTWLDIHIAGAGSYAMNNFVSLENNNLSRVVRTRGESVSKDDVVYHQNKNKYHAYNRTFAGILSGVWSQGDHAAGLFFNARSFSAVRGVPDYAARFIEYGVPDYTVQHDIGYDMQNVYASSLNFGEIQLSYAYTFLKKRRDMFMGGVSLKKLFSIAGAAANVYNVDFEVEDDTLLHVYDFQTDAMYTPEAKLYAKGGFAVDLGFTWQKMLADASGYYPHSARRGCRYIPYKWKLAASVLDIGSVKFDEEERQFAGYDFQDYEWYGYADTEVDEDDAIYLFAGPESSIDEGRVKKTHKIHLPICISVQGDYNLWASRLYANAAIVHGLPISRSKFGVRRAHSLMAGLRYESRFFDVSLPLSLYEYRSPQLGLSVRLWLLTIGTDKLFSWVGDTDLYGGDFYAHLKVPIFYNPKCRAGSRTDARSGRSGGVLRRRGKLCDAY
jgi:hypothetical protein